MSSIRKTLVGLVGVLLFVLAPVAFAQDTAQPSVTVSDQAIEDGTVTIDSVYSEGPGWIVIHIDQGGAPGMVIGQTALTDGENMNVVVEIDDSAATDTLYAMLHSDLGEAGVYEFPGADVPVTLDGQVVMEAFQVTGGMQETATAEATETVEATATTTATVETTPMATETVEATAPVTATVGGGETGTAQATPGALPETGGNSTPWTPIVLVGAGLAILIAGGLLALRRSAQDVHLDE